MNDLTLAEDRGHLYGDALFETVAVRRGRVRWLERHVARLMRSGEFLGFTEEQLDEAAEALRSIPSRAVIAGEEDGLWRVTVSRAGGLAPFGGEGAITVRRRELRIPQRPSLTFVEGSYFPGDVLREHKTSNYLHSIRARMTALERGHDDAIMTSHDGVIGEASAANLLFVMRDGEVVTPAVDGILPGITRAAVLEWAAQQGTGIEERAVLRAELSGCREVVLLSAGVGALAARDLEGRALEDGFTVRIQEWLHTVEA